MTIAKRIALFLVLNFVIVITLSAVVSLAGIGPYLEQNGINYRALMIFSLVWGMGGAFISLALSRITAKWFMGVRIIDPATTDHYEQKLLNTVYNLCRRADLEVMPEVGIYASDELNAFATGPTRSRSLVAVSSGLLEHMNDAEVEGVLGHEIAHIANGDMVTMTLLQGVVNAFVIFLSRVIAYVVAQALRDDKERGFSSGIYFLVSFILQIVFMILGSMVVAWFSRYREYRADQGGAQFAGRQNMISALQVLQRTYESVDGAQQASVSNLKISGKGHGIFRLFQSHPPLLERIERLRLP